MAQKSRPDPAERGAELADMLDELEKSLERLKVMYEQYFMGIQKMAPMTLHRTVERKFLELTQAQIRNTGLRFRLSTLTQKFGVYNTYWRRTMRKIEQGTYIRDIARVTRKAELQGGDVPEEILAAMPKRMRERIRKDREKVAARAAARAEEAAPGEAAPGEAAAVRTPRSHVHHVDLNDLEDMDFDAMFSALTDEAPTTPAAKAPPPAPRRPEPRPPARPPPSPAGKPPPPVPTTRAAGVRPPAPRPAGPALPPGITESQARERHQKYVQARKLVGEHGQVSYDRLVRTLNSQAPRIMAQHKAKAVEFNVVIKDDKVVLKAKPVKGNKE